MEKIARSFGTHDGTFHADEVTACALLRFFNLIDVDKIVRTRDLKLLETFEFVCDVGGTYEPEKKRFDHHQVDYRGHLSSAGMILEYLRSQKIITHADYDFLNNSLVRGVDAHDNGKDTAALGICTFSHIISNFTPISYEATPEEQNAAFLEAQEFALGHIKRLWERYKYTQSCREQVIHAMAEYRDCLIFDIPIPWMDTFFEQDGAHHPAKFVIMPSGKYWKLRGIPPTADDKMRVRQPLPEEWAGMLDQELKRLSGIEGAIFCHKGRFISVWATKEDALRAWEKISKK
jgi:uncharacterized UPF0160 family protein